MLSKSRFNDWPQFSVVIATLGGGTLLATISALNAGNIRPAEILICIPELEVANLSDPKADNVRVIVTPYRGQVAQRAVGFRSATHDYVLQLDDDMLVAEDCVDKLMNTLMTAQKKTAVSPALVDVETDRSLYERPKRSRLFTAIYYWLMNGSAGYCPGRILNSGVAIGVDYRQAADRVVEVEWLPGGCVLHRKEHLILENYYPFSGKAHGEDVIHSWILRQQGCALLIDAFAKCSTRTPVLPQSLGARVRCARDILRVQKYYMAKMTRRNFAVYLSYLINIARIFLDVLARRALSLFSK